MSDGGASVTTICIGLYLVFHSWSLTLPKWVLGLVALAMRFVRSNGCSFLEYVRFPQQRVAPLATSNGISVCCPTHSTDRSTRVDTADVIWYLHMWILLMFSRLPPAWELEPSRLNSTPSVGARRRLQTVKDLKQSIAGKRERKLRRELVAPAPKRRFREHRIAPRTQVLPSVRWMRFCQSHVNLAAVSDHESRICNLAWLDSDAQRLSVAIKHTRTRRYKRLRGPHDSVPAANHVDAGNHVPWTPTTKISRWRYAVAA